MIPFPNIPYTDINCPVQIVGPGRQSFKSPMRESIKLYPMDMQTNMFSKFSDRWQNVNRDIVVTLTYRLHRPPSVIQEILLRLLQTNYAKLLKNMQQWRRYGQYVSRASIAKLFDERGNLLNPLSPGTLSMLMRMLYSYICCLQRLNAAYKWHNNGIMEGNVFGLLGSQDELFKLLSRISDNSKLFNPRVLLQLLFDMHACYSQYFKTQEGISDFYTSIVANGENTIGQPSPKKKLSADNTIESDYCISRLDAGKSSHIFNVCTVGTTPNQQGNQKSCASSPCKQTSKAGQADIFKELISIWGK